jgi:PPOX class probable F420-dependent enzyme
VASRREQIRMSDEEVHSFLAEKLVMTVGTIGPKGRPHLMPLWFVQDGDELIGWTYAKSQKARNLERDPRATLQIEDGVRYEELKGVMMECDVTLDRDAKPYGLRLFRRYAGELDQDVEALVEGQAPKRVGLRFTPTRVVSWDHSKLGGAY